LYGVAGKDAFVKTRTRIIAAAVAALALLLLFLLLRGHSRPAPVHPAKQAQSAPRPTAPIAVPPPVPPGGFDPDDPLKPPSAVAGRPILQEVTFEPQPACAGRKLFVHMKGQDPDGRNGEVIYAANSGRGNPSVYTPSRVGKTDVIVSAYNLRGDYDQRTYTIDVQDCGDDVSPPITLLVDTSHPEHTAIRAQVPGVPPSTPGWSYDWDFGDGVTTTTTVPFAIHDYSNRPINRYLSTFVVQVDAHGDDGRKLSGRDTFNLTNLYTLNRVRKGIVVPEVTVEKVEVVGGVMRVIARVRHYENGVVTAKNIKARKQLCSLETAPLSEVRADHMVFQPDDELVLELPASTVVDACALGFQLEGDTSTGMDLFIDFMADIPGRTVDPAAIPGRVTFRGDDELGRKINERLALAHKLLNRPMDQPITQPELEQLEAEGKLEPLSIPLPSP
jgi:hypothetical protein